MTINSPDVPTLFFLDLAVPMLRVIDTCLPNSFGLSVPQYAFMLASLFHTFADTIAGAYMSRKPVLALRLLTLVM